MRQLFILLTSIILSTANAQGDKILNHSLIITKKKDTIKCQVEPHRFTDRYVPYFDNLSGLESKILITDVSTVITPYKTFYNIDLNDNEKLFGLVVEGRIRLLNHKIINFGDPNPSSGQWSYSPMEYSKTTWVIFKDNSAYEITKKNFKEQSSIHFNSCPELLNMIGKKQYKFSDLEYIVQTYNSCGE
jgi:CDP-glycerol glycerophosphotransferase (TagB/SpsB family)